jgi:hypothetical protein
MKGIKTFLGVLTVVVLSGCSLLTWRKGEIYDMSYDQTFDVVSAALDSQEHWQLSATDYREGTITIEKSSFFRPDEEMSFILKRIGPYRTKVALKDRHRSMYTESLFKAIDEKVRDRALTHPS